MERSDADDEQRRPEDRGARPSGSGRSPEGRSEGGAPRRGDSPRRPRQGGRPPGDTRGGPRQGGPKREGPTRDGPARNTGRGGPRQEGPARSAGRFTPRRAATPDPQLPDDVTGQELDRDVRHELATLPREAATAVARHLVMTGRLLDADPDAAYRHAMAAQRRAGRIGSVREAAGLAAYRAGRYAEALQELRAARRLTGSDVHWPVMADCERGLGRPERAVAMASAPEVERLDRDVRLELRLVVAGARSDLGQADAAVLTLQVPELTKGRSPVRARLLSAYADALAAAGRTDEAQTWLQRAAAADVDGSTGAAARLAGGAPTAADDDEVAVWDLLEDTGTGTGGDPVEPGEPGEPGES